MKKKTFLFILIGVVGFALLLKLLTVIVVEPWAEKKIRAALNEQNSDYLVEIEQIHISIFSGGIELDDIKVSSKQDTGINHNVHGEISSIRFVGINLFKALFKNDFEVRKIFISNGKISGALSPDPQKAQKEKRPIISPINLRIGEIHVDNLEMAIKNTDSPKFYSLKQGNVTVHGLQVLKKDTLTTEVAEKIDFNFGEFFFISPDSMYSLTLKSVDYAATPADFSVNSLLIQPNYADYDFSSRHKFETDRLEGGLRNITIHNFSVVDYLKSGNITSSYVEIEKMDLDVFRDKRKPFPHSNKPTFQQLIYDYPGNLNIDSIGILSGNVTYREHAEEANEAGSISFKETKAKIYNLTNDTIYKTKSEYLELKSEALLMGKGKLVISIKAKLFDKHDAFLLSGNLSAMEAKALNPMLDKNAFLIVTSGNVTSMNFSCKANNYAANGTMALRYDGLEIAIKNKRTDDTTGLKERLISFITDLKVMDSNPIPGKEVRTGIIDYKRDPERSIFNYSFKAILSGIQSSLSKNPKKEK